MSKKETPAAPPDAEYSKQQILSSKRFTPLQKDVLNALLKEDESYTIQQVNKKIEDFRKRTVG